MLMTESREELSFLAMAGVEHIISGEVYKVNSNPQSKATCFNACFDRIELNLGLGESLRGVIANLKDDEVHELLQMSDTDAVLDTLYSRLTSPQHAALGLSGHVWAAYVDPAEKVRSWLGDHMAKGVQVWVENLLREAYGSFDSSFSCWDVNGITEFVTEGLREFAEAGSLEFDTTPADVFYPSGDLNEFYEVVAAHYFVSSEVVLAA